MPCGGFERTAREDRAALAARRPARLRALGVLKLRGSRKSAMRIFAGIPRAFKEAVPHERMEKGEDARRYRRRDGLDGGARRSCTVSVRSSTACGTSACRRRSSEVVRGAERAVTGSRKRTLLSTQLARTRQRSARLLLAPSSGFEQAGKTHQGAQARATVILLTGFDPSRSIELAGSADAPCSDLLPADVPHRASQPASAGSSSSSSLLLSKSSMTAVRVDVVRSEGEAARTGIERMEGSVGRASIISGRRRRGLGVFKVR